MYLGLQSSLFVLLVYLCVFVFMLFFFSAFMRKSNNKHNLSNKCCVNLLSLHPMNLLLFLK